MRLHWWRAAIGPILTVIALAAAEAFVRGLPHVGHPGPGGVLAPVYLTIVIAAFVGGMRSALTSAAICTAFSFYFFSSPGLLNFHYPSRSLPGAVVTSASALGMAVLAGHLRTRLERQAEERVRREREHALEVATVNHELTQANGSLQAFTYLVSHDLKEPSRAVGILLDALHEDHGGTLPPEGRDLLDRSIAAHRRLSDLLQGLLDFSRASTAELIETLRPIRLKDALSAEACLTRYQQLLDARAATLEVRDGGAEALASVPALCQILGNLVVNAIKHNPAKRPHVRVTSSLRDGEVQILVEDDGPGFPPRVVEALARPDDNVPKSLKPGSGFGLMIARRAAERLGGHLELLPSPNGGVAKVTLPAARPQDALHRVQK